LAVKLSLFFLRLAISIAILWFVMRYVDLETITARLKGANSWLMVVAVLCLILQSLLATLRWREIMLALGASNPGLPRLLASYFEALFVGQVLPTTVGGDVLRVVRACGWKQSLSQAAGAVLLERVFALGWLLAIGIGGLPMWIQPGNEVDTVLVASVFGSWALAFVVFFALPSLPATLYRLRIVGGALHLSLLTYTLARRPKVMLVVAITSLGGQGAVFLATWLLARSLDLYLPFDNMIVAMPFVMLVGMIPVSLAGWGVREGAMAFALGFFGTPTTDAVLVSILLGLASVLSSLPGIAAWVVAIR
jgi:glycosyltransferase 2 family protein